MHTKVQLLWNCLECNYIEKKNFSFQNSQKKKELYKMFPVKLFYQMLRSWSSFFFTKDFLTKSFFIGKLKINVEVRYNRFQFFMSIRLNSKLLLSPIHIRIVRDVSQVLSSLPKCLVKIQYLKKVCWTFYPSAPKMPPEKLQLNNVC